MWVLKMIWDILAAFALCFWVNVAVVSILSGGQGGELNVEFICIGAIAVSLVKLELSEWHSND